MNRRTMLSIFANRGAGTFFRRQWRPSRSAEASASTASVVSIVEYSDACVRVGIIEVPKLVKPDSEWRSVLTPTVYDVTRRAGTERPFTEPAWALRHEGVYRCVCCETAIFSSATKFESGTGWPSFWAPLDKRNIEERTDVSGRMIRTAVSCRRCNAHLGHVFGDGPKPTGLRYCVNSTALRLAKRDADTGLKAVPTTNPSLRIEGSRARRRVTVRDNQPVQGTAFRPSLGIKRGRALAHGRVKLANWPAQVNLFIARVAGRLLAINRVREGEVDVRDVVAVSGERDRSRRE